MFEVLMYLFENYMDNSSAFKLDQGALVMELEQAGFTVGEIDRALDWLDGLSRAQEVVESAALMPSSGMRHFVAEESAHLNIEIRGFLLYLEQLSIMDSVTREIVIDRLMALDPREIDLGRVKWVVLITLFSQPDKKSSLSLLQDLIMSDAFDVLH